VPAQFQERFVAPSESAIDALLRRPLAGLRGRRGTVNSEN
jgi:hypothetical protein